ncbi:unnamed protein product [Rhodiola kirilowii]
MAAVKSEPGVCSDCSKWSKKYCKVEAGRNALRDAVKILQKRVEEITQENDTLKEEVKDAKSLADHEKEARVKENDAPAALKKEIISLKSELHSLQENMRTERSETAQEVSRLRACVSDSQKEIIRLKELIEKEKSSAEVALKNAEVEKAKAGEALKAAKSEKSRAEKEKKRACTESKKAQEYKIQLDALKSEADEVRSQLTLVTSKCKEANTRLEAEREKALAEIKRADLEKSEAEKQKNRAEGFEKKLAEGKHFANGLRCQLEEERKKKDEMLKKINELLSSKKPEDGSVKIDRSVGTGALVNQLEVEKNNGILENKQAVSMNAKAERQTKPEQVIEKRVIEEKSRADNLSVLFEDEKRKNHELQSKITELASSKKLLEANDSPMDKSNNAEELKKQLEIEKQKTIKEEKRANLLKAEADFQRKRAKANEMKLTEEMNRANGLSSQLDEEKRRNNELQKEVDMLVRSKDLAMGNKPLNDKDASVEELTTHGKTKKKKADRDKKCGNSKTDKVVEQQRLIPPDGIKDLGKKKLADKLTHTLQGSRKTVGTSGNQSISHSQNKLIAHAQAEEVKCLSPHKSRSSDKFELKLIREQMKIAKAQLKHAKRVSKFERVRSSILKKELDILKQEFFQFSNRLDFLDRSLSCKAEGANVSFKVQGAPFLRWKDQKLLGLKPSPIGGECRNSLCVINKPSDNVGQPSKQALSPHFSGIKLTESTSGTNSKLDPPAGSSGENLFDSSAINSSRASFSDRGVADAQENFRPATTSSNPSDGINMQLTDSRLYGEVTELMHSVNPAMATNNVVGSHNNADFGGEPVHDKKRKRVLSLLDSFRYAFSESKKLHMQMEENVSTLHNVLRSSVDISMYHDNSYDRFDEPYKKRKVFHEQKVSSQRSPNGKCFVEPENAELNGDTVDLGMGSLATVPSNGALVCKASNDVLSTENCRHPSESIDHVNFEDYMILLDLDDHEDEKRYRVARDNLLSPSLPEIDFRTGNAFSVDEVDLTVKDASNERHSWTAQRPLVQEDDKRVDCFKVDECTKHGLPNMAADGSNLEAHGAISPSKTLLNEDLTNLYVVHSEIVDREKLSRIFDATRKGVSECHSSSSPGVLLKRVLNYINHGDLLLKDKECVFFSMLLTGCNVAAKKELSDPVRESTVILNSYMAGLNSAIRDVETLNILKQTLSLHELINLMEEFLMNGRIWVCRIRDGIPSGAVDSSVPIGDMKLTVEAASTDQLVVTGAILASICVAFDDIEFIRLLAYNLFRLHKYNYTEVLSVVHVFVQLAGRKFLTSTSNSMLTSVVKSLVLFLERSHSPCSKCPFSEEAVSLDDVLFLLIERLQFFMKKAKTQIHSNGSLEEKLNPEIADTRSGSSLEETFSQFSDVLSLVELIANNVSWDILSCKVVPQLLLMLESSTMDIFSMAIIVFLGQLGRLGVSASGPEDTGVDRLRCQLTAMLGCDKRGKVILPIQMAAVSSLLGILNLDLNSLHHGGDLNPCVAEASSACLIREWFTSLSEGQQSFFMDLALQM